MPQEDDEEDEEEDMEEVFPTIGPYQCEICQMITDTKAEFVGHIKAEHRNVVDEDVLRSLEADIRKSKKKQGHSKRPKKMLKLHILSTHRRRSTRSTCSSLWELFSAHDHQLDKPR